ncbi:hypothetical protein [Evansella cellulosilytica]|uniref:YhfM-like domain-containing protein n=1 Tax=Evansella cellulosilytica (strain ATCC 21833 / DSM 2522 / FERM P-1141 / JCM 9156 / N-4) TaxID=649639 RepID=E6TRX2_EVAC2|nr:hypothetical protein [Evansella cellulosilytica]ADU29495.1 hypothetical protein Bcell_1230 [Evansella cellulosilytica DSM 2522]
MGFSYQASVAIAIQIKGTEKVGLYFFSGLEIKAFVDAINTSKRMKGSVDMPEGDYDLSFISLDGTLDGFHIWISEESLAGTIIHITDTEAAYKLTKKSTNTIRDILSD